MHDKQFKLQNINKHIYMISSRMALVMVLVIVARGCQDANCVDCNNFIARDSSGNKFIKQICFTCIQGFLLQNQACIVNESLSIGMFTGTALAIILEIVCIFFCQRYNKEKNKKKAINLKQIFQHHDKKEDLLQIHDKQLKNCHKLFFGKKCDQCDQPATLKTNCNHYFDLKCFYTKIEENLNQIKKDNKGINKKNPKPEFAKCPYSNCDKNGAEFFLPFKQVCHKCKSRHIELHKLLQTASNYREYTCAHCKLQQIYQIDQAQKEEQQNDDKIQSQNVIMTDNINNP